MSLCTNFPGGGVTLYYNYTPCAFSLKIIGTLLRTAGTESHPLLRTDKKYTHPLLQSKVPAFADIPIAYTGSWKGVQPGRGTGVELRGLWTWKFIAFIKNFQKSKLGSVLVSGGPICSCADPLFKANPLNRNNWNIHGVIPTYRVTHPGQIIRGLTQNLIRLVYCLGAGKREFLSKLPQYHPCFRAFCINKKCMHLI
jgi:hypothetical protein